MYCFERFSIMYKIMVDMDGELSTHLYEKLLFVAGNNEMNTLLFGFFTQPKNQLNKKRFDSLDCWIFMDKIIGVLPRLDLKRQYTELVDLFYCQSLILSPFTDDLVLTITPVRFLMHIETRAKTFYLKLDQRQKRKRKSDIRFI